MWGIIALTNQDEQGEIMKIVKARAYTVKHTGYQNYDSSSISWTRTKTGEVGEVVYGVIAEDETTAVIATDLTYEQLVELYIDELDFHPGDAFYVAQVAEEKAYNT